MDPPLLYRHQKRNVTYCPYPARPWLRLHHLIADRPEPNGGFVGAAVGFDQAALPRAMDFAAGTMLFVIVDEIIPDIDQKAFDHRGTVGLMWSLVTMVFLDIAMG